MNRRKVEIARGEDYKIMYLKIFVTVNVFRFFPITKRVKGVAD